MRGTYARLETDHFREMGLGRQTQAYVIHSNLRSVKLQVAFMREALAMARENLRPGSLLLSNTPLEDV